MIALGKSLKRKITGVIHGAGLEDSKLVADKGHDIFDRVVEVHGQRLEVTDGSNRVVRDKVSQIRRMFHQCCWKIRPMEDRLTTLLPTVSSMPRWHDSRQVANVAQWP